ncbi:MAG TPA: Stk1 family PASTA domain-containing Ser/Thr kinase [Euzebyales bacterium]|nr:Stk1 family PASTA domain-containing Ser/Thr kinase [Euzebyales bacterium]
MDDTRPLSGVPGVLAGRYRLLGSIGQGGMADVQRAYDEQLDREVAVKILHARYSDDRSFLLRFRREAQAAASLNHPNIVSVYDAGDANGRPFIVMELVRGRSLRDLTRSERTTAGRAIEIVGDAALALNYAHEHGLIHRDIKPGNILVSHEGDVKVTDFGIARAVNAETITETAAVFGTAAYVSPEQAQGETVDRRTDVYSLGCVLYELLAGQQPFHADSPVALAYQHVSTMPTPPSHLSDESTPELDAITLKAMAKHPDDRYQTARDFNADLERARAGVPVTAPMGGAAYAATQMVGRADDPTMVSSRAPSYTQSYPPEEDYRDDYYDDDEPPNRTGWIIFGILLLLALLVGGWFLVNNLTGNQVDTAVLPDVVGTNVEEAQRNLNSLGFTDIEIEETEQSDAEVDEVVEQDPAPSDEEIPVDTPIVLTVNTGVPMVEVPDLREMTRREAAEALAEVNLRVGETSREDSDDVDENRVIRSDPDAGEEVEEDSRVDLVISSGSSRAEVPDVVGETQSDAELALSEACEPQPCFEVSTSTDFSDEPEGTVITQTPEGGQEAEKGSRVALVISRGPEEEPEPTPPPPVEPDMTAVPDVIGDPANEAQAEIAAADLIPNIIQQPDDDIEAGLVIATDPGPGAELEVLSAVDVIVSTGPESNGDGGEEEGG